jgi:hypothetical protein
MLAGKDYILATVDRKVCVSRLENGAEVKEPEKGFEVRKFAIFPEQNLMALGAGNYSFLSSALSVVGQGYIGSSPELADEIISSLQEAISETRKRWRPLGDYDRAHVSIGLFRKDTETGERSPLIASAKLFKLDKPRVEVTASFDTNASYKSWDPIEEVYAGCNPGFPKLEQAVRLAVKCQETAHSSNPEKVSKDFDTFLLRADKPPVKVELIGTNGLVKIASEIPVENMLILDDIPFPLRFGVD